MAPAASPRQTLPAIARGTSSPERLSTNRLCNRLAANTERAGDRSVAHSELSQLPRLGSDPLVGRHLQRINYHRLDQNRRRGSNSLSASTSTGRRFSFQIRAEVSFGVKGRHP